MSKAGVYSKYGVKAAKLSLSFPGLGQLYNKNYVKGMLVIGTFSFAVAFRLLLLTQPAVHSHSPLKTILLVVVLVVWGLAIFDAYHSAIEARRRDAKRFDVQVLTTIHGFDTNDSGFDEVTMTKNLSKLGACLIMSREINEGSQLSLEFEGKSKSLARVIWARETGNRDERLVGVELLTPLKEL